MTSFAGLTAPKAWREKEGGWIHRLRLHGPDLSRILFENTLSNCNTRMLTRPKEHCRNNNAPKLFVLRKIFPF